MADTVIPVGDELWWTTNGAYPDLRSYTMANPSDADDQIHFVSSYNLSWNGSAWVKPDTARPAFHLVTESEYGDFIELNFDWTKRGDAVVRRSLGMEMDVVTGLAKFNFWTDGVNNYNFQIGQTAAQVMKWTGASASVAMEFDIKNTSSSGHAHMQVENSDAVRGYLHMGPADAGSNLQWGRPAGDLFSVVADRELALGSEGSYRVNFVTNSTVRGGIAADGSWFQTYNGQEYDFVPVIVSDATPTASDDAPVGTLWIKRL